MTKLCSCFLAMLFALSACSSTSSKYPTIDKAELQLEKQRQFEAFSFKKLEKEHKSQEKFLKNQMRVVQISKKISLAGLDLCRRLDKGENGCIYKFELSKGKDINAYADGKKIVITQAMVNFAKTDEELSLVLGHEFAHNMFGHVKSTKKNAMIGSFLGTVLDGVAKSQGIATGSSLSKLGSHYGVMKFSKDFEREADYIGLYITSMAGYNINKAPNFWRRMSERSEKAIYVAQTHPTTAERYLSLEKTVAEIKRKKKNGALLVPNLKK